MKYKLKGKKFLITAGPTREYIDPVRYISNVSSGKMGYALAESAIKTGAKVVLISGPTNLNPPKNSKFISITTAQEMYKATLKEMKNSDIIICSAAVSDFRPIKTKKRKIKKPGLQSIKLTENPDILMSLGKRKRKGQTLIGFALETENIIENAKKKMREKNCDFIIANGCANIGASKASVVLLSKNGVKKTFKKLNKRELGLKLLDEIDLL